MLRAASSALIVLVVSFLATPSLCAAQHMAPATRTHEQALQTEHGRFIQDLGNQAIEIIANKQLSQEQKSNEFSRILGESFDLKTIGRFVIGRAWFQATEAQQVEYMDLFKALVIRNYGSRMTLYTGEGFQVVGTRPESELDTTVLSQITHPDGSKATAIDWRVRKKDNRIGVIDVIVEGVSLSITQKQAYASIIQNNAGQIEGLLKLMRAQLRDDVASTKK